MKTRPVAPLTPEDLSIIATYGQVPRYVVQAQHVQGRGIFVGDRRDAALMLALMECGPMLKGYAAAHRALRGAADRRDWIYINGYLVGLA
jgi:hypothetical protein